MPTTPTQNDRMLTESPPKLILSLSLPATAALLVSAACGIADAWFVSLLGTAASGAVGIAFAITALIQAVGYTLGTGAGSLISRALGAADQAYADYYASRAFALSLALGGAIALLGSLFLGPTVQLLGASEEIYPFARAYARFLFPAAPLACGGFVLNNLLRAEGQVGFATVGTVAGNLLNILLDPLFLFAFSMGIGGAALAFLLSQAVTFCILLSRYLFGKTRVSLLPARQKQAKPRLSELLRIGAPSLFRQGLAGVASALLLRRARQYGNAASAAVSINARIFLLLYGFCLGIGQGVMPAAGYNHGAKHPHRVLALSRFALILATAVMLVLSIPVGILAPRIIGLFRTETEVREIGAVLLRAQCAIFFLHGVIAVTNMLLQALGKAFPATLIAAARQGICFLPAYLVLPRIGGLTGLCLVQAVADVLTFLLTLPFLITTLRELAKKRATPAKDRSAGVARSQTNQ